MARPPRDPNARLERPGQRPILQGHLRQGGRPAIAGPAPAPAAQPVEQPAAKPDAEGLATGGKRTTGKRTTGKRTTGKSVQPAAKGVTGESAATRGKAARSPAEVATRRHLEGAEQGPK